VRFADKNVSSSLVRICRGVTQVIGLCTKVRRASKGYASVQRFGSRGDDFVFDPDGEYSYESIFVGDHVNLGVRPTLLATRATIRIGNHVMFGPQVTIRGGNHRFDLVGRYIDSISDDEKRHEDDRGVIISDDVWIGGNATVLHGVHIGRGSVVAAGAVVTKSVPPYSIVAGNPARVVRARFTPEEIVEHEARLLFPDEERP
jgi:acetyltransferase-like isoleucine patch superfamily enzyme